jgi:Flp pilus assembly protein TadD
MSLITLNTRASRFVCTLRLNSSWRLYSPIAAALLVSACAQGGSNGLVIPSPDVSKSMLPDVATVNTARADAATQKALTPSLTTVVEKARAERENRRPDKAMAMLDRAAKKAPKNKALAKERGLLALEMGQLDKAEKLIKTAMQDETPDWRLYSALGSTLAAKGDQKNAQAQVAKALELAPEHPSILNNLALSYALQGRHKKAEDLLRQASKGNNARLQTKQNLALLLGLDGKISEARRISRAALPEDDAEVNIGFLESLKRRTAKVSRAEPAATNDAVRSATNSSDADTKR